MPGIRFCAVEANTAYLPSPEMPGCVLVPSAGVTPSGVETRMVVGAQVLLAEPIVVTQVERSKISLSPLGLDPASRFVALETKETNRPVLAIAGFELGPLPAAVPSAETESRYVVGVQPLSVASGTIEQVSWMNACGVTPSNPPGGGVVTRFVARETNAT